MSRSMGECVGCGRRFVLLTGPKWEPPTAPVVPPHDRVTGSLGQIAERCGGSGLAPAGDGR